MSALLTRRRVSQPPALAANQLTDLAVWLDASTLSDADGTALASWTDSSGNARHATQGTGANQPLVKTAILNGKRVVRFDGSNDYLSAAYTGEPATFVAVYYNRTSNVTSYYGLAAGKSSANLSAWYMMASDPDATLKWIRTLASDAVPFNLGAATLAPVNNWTIVVGTFDSATRTVKLRVNGKAVADQRVNGTSSLKSIVTGMVVGAQWYNGTVGDFASVDIAEMAIYSTVKTDTEIDQLGRGLAAKWALPWTEPEPTSFTYLAAVFSRAFEGVTIGGPEAMYLLGSNDGTTWSRAAGRFPTYTPDALGAAGAIRDPDIYKHTDGYWYLAYTAATGYDAAGFDERTNTVGLARSADLKTWTHIGTPALSGVAGTANTWAPQWFVDGGNVYLLVSISTTGSSGNFTMYAVPVTDMAAGTLGAPAAIGGTAWPASCIDPTIVKIGSTYHLIYKDETVNKRINRATSTSPLSGYSTVQTGIITFAEGPSAVFMGGTTWRLYVDRYQNAGGNRLAYLTSTDDMATWSAATTVAYDSSLSQFAASYGAQHGSVVVRT